MALLNNSAIKTSPVASRIISKSTHRWKISAIEAVCDFLETRENEKIRAIKDIAAAAVGIGVVVWLTVVILDLVRLAALLLESGSG